MSSYEVVPTSDVEVPQAGAALLARTGDPPGARRATADGGRLAAQRRRGGNPRPIRHQSAFHRRCRARVHPLLARPGNPVEHLEFAVRPARSPPVGTLHGDPGQGHQPASDDTPVETRSRGLRRPRAGRYQPGIQRTPGPGICTLLAGERRRPQYLEHQVPAVRQTAVGLLEPRDGYPA